MERCETGTRSGKRARRRGCDAEMRDMQRLAFHDVDGTGLGPVCYVAVVGPRSGSLGGCPSNIAA